MECTYLGECAHLGECAYLSECAYLGECAYLDRCLSGCNLFFRYSFTKCMENRIPQTRKAIEDLSRNEMTVCVCVCVCVRACVLCLQLCTQSIPKLRLQLSTYPGLLNNSERIG